MKTSYSDSINQHRKAEKIPAIFRSAKRQLWPLVVMMLRIPIAITRGHPLQVHAGVLAVLRPFLHIGAQR
jgi:hypothetical protein